MTQRINWSTSVRPLLCTVLAVGLSIAFSIATASGGVNTSRSIADRSVHWPTWSDWQQLVLLRDYNTRVVIIGVSLLGCAAGMVGSFTLLRKRALMGDALSHATLPGIGLAFIVATEWGYDGKSLPILLLGATLTGLLGVATILVIRNLTQLKEDTALGAVLSVFFGGGVAILGVIQQMQDGHAAGLESFIYGKTASMGIRDTQLIVVAAATCIGVCLVLFKELKLLCFDEGFAAARGFPAVRLDIVLMALVVTVCIVGLQAVGLILVIALLVIPAAAARFWTEQMWSMFMISGALGAAGGMVGAGASAVFSRLPSGAMIVLVCTAFFLISLIFGTSRGVLVRSLRRRRLNRTVDRQHLLRALYELMESAYGREGPSPAELSGEQVISVSMDQLLHKRSWSLQRLRHSVDRAQKAGLLDRQHATDRQASVRLTDTGLREAFRLTHQHRLWELYLITHAEIAPSRVDREADAIEHILEPELIMELESLLEDEYSGMPESPHEVGATEGATEGATRVGASKHIMGQPLMRRTRRR